MYNMVYCSHKEREVFSMADIIKNPKVDGFIGRATKWRAEFEKLREIALDCGLREELKWGKPSYSYGGGNVIIIQGFKNYCALLFVKGVLLRDEGGLLIQMTENMQAARQLRFTGLGEIAGMEPVIRAYIVEAIEVEKSGAEVPMKKTAEFAVPEEFQKRLDEDPALAAAFGALTPGRQRGYLLHFSQPKLRATRETRVEKSIPRIFDGMGLND